MIVPFCGFVVAIVNFVKDLRALEPIEAPIKPVKAEPSIIKQPDPTTPKWTLKDIGDNESEVVWNIKQDR